METSPKGWHEAGQFGVRGCDPQAVAWCWIGEDEGVQIRQVARDGYEKTILDLVAELRKADLVTCHNPRKFDHPICNAAMLRMHQAPLPPLLTQDTLRDLPKTAGMPRDQEYLAAMLGLAESKLHLNKWDWEQADRGDPIALEKIRRRVHDDVVQHMALYLALKGLGWLHGPRYWKP